MDAKIQNLTFGVELELHTRNPNGAAAAVAAAIGKPCPVEGYNHYDRGHWKVVTDGSLGGGDGWEFVSPPLKGEEGLAELKKVLETLVAQGATVGRDCGTHVHVGVGTDPDLGFLKRLMKGYAVYESAIDTVMAPSRRGNVNTYCRSLTTIPLTQIDAATSRYALISLMRAGRFTKLNLTMRHPTVEFRQHQGTLEYDKLSNWVLMCLRLVAAAKDDTLELPTMMTTESTGGGPQLNRARRGSKARIIGDLLLRTEGTTAREVMRTVGWPSVSIPQQARLCGLRVVRERMGRSVRYYARAAEATVVTREATLDRLLNVLQAPTAEREYFTARVARWNGRQRAAA